MFIHPKAIGYATHGHMSNKTVFLAWTRTLALTRPAICLSKAQWRGALVFIQPKSTPTQRTMRLEHKVGFSPCCFYKPSERGLNPHSFPPKSSRFWSSFVSSSLRAKDLCTKATWHGLGLGLGLTQDCFSRILWHCFFPP